MRHAHFEIKDRLKLHCRETPVVLRRSRDVTKADRRRNLPSFRGLSQLLCRRCVCVVPCAATTAVWEKEQK